MVYACLGNGRAVYRVYNHLICTDVVLHEDGAAGSFVGGVVGAEGRREVEAVGDAGSCTVHARVRDALMEMGAGQRMQRITSCHRHDRRPTREQRTSGPCEGEEGGEPVRHVHQAPEVPRHEAEALLDIVWCCCWVLRMGWGWKGWDGERRSPFSLPSLCLQELDGCIHARTPPCILSLMRGRMGTYTNLLRARG